MTKSNKTLFFLFLFYIYSERAAVWARVTQPPSVDSGPSSKDSRETLTRSKAWFLSSNNETVWSVWLSSAVYVTFARVVCVKICSPLLGFFTEWLVSKSCNCLRIVMAKNACDCTVLLEKLYLRIHACRWVRNLLFRLWSGHVSFGRYSLPITDQFSKSARFIDMNLLFRFF